MPDMPSREGRRIDVAGSCRASGSALGLPARRRARITGRVRNDRAGVSIDAFGAPADLDAFLRSLTTAAPAAARVEDVRWRPIPDEPYDDFAIAPSTGGGAARLDSARSRDLPRVPRRDLRPGEPALPVPVHELHELRPALHDRDATSLRPRGDVDGGLSMCPACQREHDDAARPALSRAAERVPGVRTASARRSPTDDAACATRSVGRRRAARRPHRRGEGPRRLPPRVRRVVEHGGAAAADPQAPRREAVRGDGPRPGGRHGRSSRSMTRVARSSNQWSARSCWAGAGRRTVAREVAPAAGSWACSCRIRRCTTCCWPTPACRW